MKLFFFIYFLTVFVICNTLSWTQQYGDSGSTNYVPITQTSLTTGWNYSVYNDYDYYPVSHFSNSPSVSSKDGVIFLPFAFSRPPPQILVLQIRAVSTEGKELWVTSGTLDNGNKACAYLLMTNTLYSEEHDMVIAGWSCAKAWPYYKKQGQLIGINASNGSIIWKTPTLKVNDVATISMNKDTIFLSAGLNCDDGYTDTNINEELKTNNSLIIGIDILTGNISWILNETNTGCRIAQTKISGQLHDGTNMVVFPVNLPNGPYTAGDILSLKCSSSHKKCSQSWLKHIGITYNAQFAFSNTGSIMYGTYGLAANPNQVFALDTQTGNILFNRGGACSSGAFPSGPAVDTVGNAYFSCGNKVFAVNSKGDLLWESKTVNNYGYSFDNYFKLSPAIHLKKSLIVFIDANSTYIYALSSKDGSMIGVTSITELRGYNGCTEPPIIVGDAMYIIKDEADYSKSFLYSVALNKLLYI